MKKNNIRKNVALVLTFFLSFLLYSEFVNAEGGLADRQSDFIMKASKYKDVTCEITGDTDYFTLTRNEDVNHNYTNYQVSTGSSPDKKEAHIVCKAKEIADGFYAQEKEYKFNYLKNEVQVSSLDYDYNITLNIVMQFHGDKYFIMDSSGLSGKVSNVQLVGGARNGDGYTVTQADQEVIVSITSTTYRPEVKNDTFDIKYTDETGASVTAHVIMTIDYNGKVRAYPGAYGTCDLSGWTYDNNNGFYVKDVDGSGSVYLPNCEPKSNSSRVKVEFLGWTLAQSTISQGAGECASQLVTNGGGNVTPQVGQYNYYACYKYSYLTSLLVSFGEVADSNFEKNGYEYFYKGDAESFTLPDVTNLPSGYEFLGWVPNTGIETKNAGDTVTNTGTIWSASYKRTQTFGENLDFVRDMAVGETILFAIAGKDINSCTSNSDNVEVKVSNGECSMTGKKGTNGEYSVLVTVTDTDGKTYKVKVGVTEGQASGDYYFDLDTKQWFSNDSDSGHGGAPQDSNSSNYQDGGDFSGDGCTYKLASKVRPNDASIGWSSAYESDINSYAPTAPYIYNLEYVCGSQNKIARTLCLDPGKVGPTIGDVFVVDFDLNKSKDSYKNLYGTTKKIVGNKSVEQMHAELENYNTLAAADIAVRVADYADNSCTGDNGGGSSWATRHNNFFKALCNEYVSGNSITGNTTSEYNKTGTWVPDKATQVSAVNSYLSNDISDGASGGTPTSIHWNVNSATLEAGTYKSDITLSIEGDTTGLSYKIVCPEPGRCNDSGSDIQNGVLKITYNGSIPADAVNFGFDVYAGGSSVKVLKDKTHPNAQRLIALGNVPDSFFIPALNQLLCPATFAEWASSTYKNKDCCYKYTPTADEQILYDSLCNTNCTDISYELSCDVENPKERDEMYYKEGSNSGSDLYGACVIFTESGRTTITDQEKYQKYSAGLTDIANNKLGVRDYEGNPYCRYTCSEEWEWSFEGYGSFTGSNAKFAGTFFQVKKDVYLSGKSKCVSTYVDYDRYAKEMEQLTNSMVGYYNQYAEVANLLYQVDKTAGTEKTINKDGSVTTGTRTKNLEDNRIRHKTECYYYGKNIKQYTNESYCGWNDYGSYSAGKCSGYSNSSGSEYWNTESGTGEKNKMCEQDTATYTAAVAATATTAATPAKCGTDTTTSNWTIEGTTCYRHRVRTAKSCYGYSGGTGKDDRKLSSKTYKFDCSDYEVVASRSVDTNKFDQYVNKKITEAKTNAVEYFVIKNGYFQAGNTPATQFNSDLLVKPKNDIDYKYSTNGGLKFGKEIEMNDGFSVDDPRGDEYNTNCNDEDYKTCELNGNDPGGKGKEESNLADAEDYYTDIVEKKIKYTPYQPGDGDAYRFEARGFTAGAGSGKLLHELQEEALNQIGEIREKIIKKAEAFDKCQNTSVANTKGAHQQNEEKYKVTYSSGKVVEPSASNTLLNTLVESKGNVIKTNYDPKISYIYDETTYLSQVEDTNLYENIDGYGHYDGTTGHTLWDNYTDKLEAQYNGTGNAQGEKIDAMGKSIYINWREENYYKDALGWASTSTNGRNYSGDAAARNLTWVELLTCGGKYDKDNGRKFESFGKGVCKMTKFYMYEVNYNKFSLLNGAFYSNDGMWLSSSVSNVAEHIEAEEVTGPSSRVNRKNYVISDTDNTKMRDKVKQNMIAVAGKYGNDVGEWRVIGSTHNVFPIRFDTPRNLYQYAYSMSDIGVYFAEDAALGRVMGYKNSTIKYNTYACFYEVKEKFCQCCGAAITTNISEYTNVNTAEAAGKTGYSMSGDTSKKVGELGFYPSSVSLYDLDGQGTIEGNWGTNKSIYYLAENTGVTTDRGDKLRKYIESNGDEVYDDSKGFIEYSYTLTPSILSSIRNNKYKYGILDSEVKYLENGVYNYYSANPAGQNGTEADTDALAPRFVHLKSLFLEDTASAWVTSGYGNKILTNRHKVCYVTGSTINSNLKTYTTDASKDCRWVDYIEGNYRMAFK